MAVDIKKAYVKLQRGDALTYDEMKGLTDHFEQTAAMLAPLGPTFHFAWREANERALQCREYTHRLPRAG